MTTPAQPPVAGVPPFTIDGGDAAFLNGPVLMFTVPVGVPARIDAVYMEITYPAMSTIGTDMYAIQLYAPGGPPQAMVWSPVYTQDPITNAGIIFLTWMRGGVGTDQLAAPAWFDDDKTDLDGFFTSTLALPDTVLQPNAQVNVFRAGGLAGSSPQVIVNNASVTYTPNAGPVSSTDLIDILPLLVPTSTG